MEHYIILCPRLNWELVVLVITDESPARNEDCIKKKF
jgi:hypothetical protein